MKWHEVPRECPPPGSYWFRDGLGNGHVLKAVRGGGIEDTFSGSIFTWESFRKRISGVAGPIPEPEEDS